MGSIQEGKKVTFYESQVLAPHLALEVETKKTKLIMNLNVLHKHWTNMMSCNDLEKENIMLWPTTPKPQVNENVVVVGCVENGQTNNLKKPQTSMWKVRRYFWGRLACFGMYVLPLFYTT